MEDNFTFTNNTAIIDNNENNTITFAIGFSILIVFLLMGVGASVFLCLTLKKDSYLWETDYNNSKNVEKGSDDEKFNSTQM